MVGAVRTGWGGLKGPRSKTVYNEEAAGLLGTGSHYRSSSSATRLRPRRTPRERRATGSMHLQLQLRRSSVTAAPHTRALSNSPLLAPFSLFLSLCLYRRPVSSRTGRSVLSILLSSHSPISLILSLLLGQAGALRVSFSICASSLLPEHVSLPFSRLLNRASGFCPLSLFLSFFFFCLSRSFRSARVRRPSSRAVARVRSFFAPADHTHTGVAHYPI